MAITLEDIDADLPRKEALRKIQLNFNRVSGLGEEVENLRAQLAQLWTGVNATGSSTQPPTGCEYNMKRWYVDVPLGATSASYTDWTPRVIGSGFTIWSIAPENYSHHSKNSVYMDDQPLTNEGEAASISITAFGSVLFYDATAPSYTDYTSEAGTEYGDEFSLMDETGDYLYVGAAAVFAGITMDFKTPALGYTLVEEYWDGASWSTLATTDNTNNWTRNNTITWTAPSDWALTVVNAVNMYWVRFSTTTTPDRVAEAYYAAPDTSVVTKILLSEDELEAKDYKFCSYGNTLYVSLPSEGDPDYEGSTYVRSGSSATNLQNYFASNHAFDAFYENVLWTGGDIALQMRRFEQAGAPSPEVNEKLWWYDTNNGKLYMVYGDEDLGTKKVEFT